MILSASSNEWEINLELKQMTPAVLEFFGNLTQKQIPS